jgi:CDP-diacylglycerol--glycerol-3-phosphate 3-phosphatidyltransferase
MSAFLASAGHGWDCKTAHKEKIWLMNLANLITISRFPVLILLLIMLSYGGPVIRLLAVPLTIILILMDTLDGMVARRRGESTLVGSALDIAADRAVEICLWVIFAHLGLIPALVPLTFIIRGALTDSIRNVALQDGQSAHSMMRSRIGHWLVAGRFMRSSYAIVKAVAFSVLAFWLAVETLYTSWEEVVAWAAQALTWLSLIMCIVRGVPVLVEAPRLFSSDGLVAAPPSDQ